MQPQSAQWKLVERVGARDLAFFRRRSGKPMTDGVPHFYTVEGYRKHFIEERTTLTAAAGRDSWVLGPEYARFQAGETGVDIVRKAEELYLSDYIREWDALLADLGLVTPANVEELADMLRAVSQPDSPVKFVLKAISEQTQLAAALRKQEQPAGQLDKLNGPVRSYIGQASDPDVDPAEGVDLHFRPLIELVEGKDGRPPPIDAILQPLGELSSFILQTRQAGADPRQAPDDFSTEFPKATALAAQLQAQAKAQPEPVKRWLRQVANAVRAL
jgi:type VI secretion system protein ImpL